MTRVDQDVNKFLKRIGFDIEKDKQDNVYPFGLTSMFKNEDNESKIAQVELIFRSAFASERLYYKLLPLIRKRKLLKNKDELWDEFYLNEDFFQDNGKQGFWAIFHGDKYTAAYMVLNTKDDYSSFIVFGSIPYLINLNRGSTFQDIINILFQQKENPNFSACIHCGTGVK